MPNVDEMYPSKYLSFRDFMPGDLQVGTIKMVALEAARVSNFGGNQGQQAPTPEWILFFNEYSKPLKLRKSRASVIAKLLGTPNTDQWTGKKIGFYRGVITIAGDAVEGLLLDVRLPSPDPSRALGSGPQGQDALPIGADTAASVIATLRERGQTPETLIKHLAGTGTPDLIGGKSPPEWPRAILPIARKFAAGFPKSQAPMTLEAIARLKASWAPPSSPAPAGGAVRLEAAVEAGYEPIQEDDIPF